MRRPLLAALTRCLLSVSIIGACAPAYAIVVLDQVNDQLSVALRYGISSDLAFQQGIKAGRTGTLDSVELYFWEAATVELTIHDNAPWNLDKSYISTVSATPGWNRFDVSSGNVSVIAGDSFSVGIRGTEQYSDLEFGGTESFFVDPNYPDGELYVNGSVVRQDIILDMGFRTYVDDVGDVTPKNYGLFVGVRDSYSSGGELRGDEEAQSLAMLFGALPNSVGVALTGDRVSGTGLTEGDIANQLSILKGQMTPNDTLVVYFSAHGVSTFSDVDRPTTYGVGDELAVLGTGNDRYLSDDTLTRLLSSMGEIDIMVLMDVCMSGGFWGSSDPFEILDNRDLEQLSRIALLTTSAENGLSYGLEPDGAGILYSALEELWEGVGSGIFTIEQLYEAVSTYPDRHNIKYEGTFVWERGFGDRVAFSPDLFSARLNVSSDFRGVINASVPEPGTWAAMLIGFMVVGGALRKSRNRISARMELNND